ncbi:hypothetical protein CSC76_17170 [Pseudoxanthomonas mexicana]|nr:hypothetical protein CSC76_17170 [Pseudoxanthomonas mexicana]
MLRQTFHAFHFKALSVIRLIKLSPPASLTVPVHGKNRTFIVEQHARGKEEGHLHHTSDHKLRVGRDS